MKVRIPYKAFLGTILYSSFLNRGFPRFGLRNSGLVVVVLARLNSFETLRLKTFGKKQSIVV